VPRFYNALWESRRRLPRLTGPAYTCSEMDEAMATIRRRLCESAEVTEAMRVAPNDAGVLRMASGMEARRGRWQESLAHAEQAMRLDPRSRGSKITLYDKLLRLHKFPEAVVLGREAMADRPRDLNTANSLTLLYLMQGDLASAQAVIRNVPADVPRTAVATYFATYQDLYWVLEDDDQKLVMRLGPSMFDNDRATWAAVQMQLATLRGDRARARALADTAQAEFTKQLQMTPNDPQQHIFRGLALATLGRKDEAIAEATRGASFNPLSQDQVNGPYYQHQIGCQEQARDDDDYRRRLGAQGS